MNRNIRIGALILGAGALVCAGLVALGLGSSDTEPPGRPNIVFIMADDVSYNVLPHMKAVQDMADQGVTFENFIVSNSLCCPSRGGYLTGKYPHNNFIQTNRWPLGGWGQFLENDVNESVGVYLDNANYKTGFMGKLLNHYDPLGFDDGVGGEPDYEEAYVPAGWDEAWLVSNGYQQFDYWLTEKVDGPAEIVHIEGSAETNYLTDQMAAKAEDFIGRNADQHFFLTLTPFSVHFGIGGDPEGGNRFPAAPRDRPMSTTWPDGWANPEFVLDGDCGGTVEDEDVSGCPEAAAAYPPDPENFNKPVINAPAWVPGHELGPTNLAKAKAWYLDRLRMAQSVDDLIVRVRAALVAAGVDDTTYLVFGSDNGYYLGDHALFDGKTTPYDHDVRLPLVVVPPGGTTARTATELVQNVDLLPTFADIAGVHSFAEPVDGRSFLGLIDGTAGGQWRGSALIQHVLDAADPQAGRDPDARKKANSADVSVPTYRAIRTADYMYADYGGVDTTRPPNHRTAEYFDLVHDPFETVNIYDSLSVDRKEALNAALLAYSTCAGSTCWSAGLVVP